MMGYVERYLEEQKERGGRQLYPYLKYLSLSIQSREEIRRLRSSGRARKRGGGTPFGKRNNRWVLLFIVLLSAQGCFPLFLLCFSIVVQNLFG
jgi:hypothetical protein